MSSFPLLSWLQGSVIQNLKVASPTGNKTVHKWQLIITCAVTQRRTQTAVSYLVWHQRGVRHYSLKRDQAKSRVFILCSSFLLDFTFQIPHLISSGTSHRRHSVIAFRCNKYIWPWGVLRSVAKSSFQDFKITSAENSNTGISTSRRDCIETFLVVWKSPCSTSETNRQNAGEIIYPGW